METVTRWSKHKGQWPFTTLIPCQASIICVCFGFKGKQNLSDMSLPLFREALYCKFVVG